jgi:hypothetical protein
MARRVTVATAARAQRRLVERDPQRFNPALEPCRSSKSTRALYLCGLQRGDDYLCLQKMNGCGPRSGRHGFPQWKLGGRIKKRQEVGKAWDLRPGVLSAPRSPILGSQFLDCYQTGNVCGEAGCARFESN